jgi:hypothetical protein
VVHVQGGAGDGGGQGGQQEGAGVAHLRRLHTPVKAMSADAVYL